MDRRVYKEAEHKVTMGKVSEVEGFATIKQKVLEKEKHSEVEKAESLL